ncbi:MAG: 30S ribosomal protein S16 [Acidimicrobiia bacterium]|nr:30S ribosomal protein S16 [Acidimicrobiia bacterium]
MPVKIRLTRMGKKKQPSYRVVVVDSRKPRDGAYIEQIGRYDPRQEPSLVEIDNERALDWLQKGAQPTERAKKLLEISGAWTRYAVGRGDIHTVGSVAVPQPEPDPAPAVVAEEASVEEASVEEASVEEASVEETADEEPAPAVAEAEETVAEAEAGEAAAEADSDDETKAGE